MAKEPYIISKEERSMLRQIKGRHAVSHRPHRDLFLATQEVRDYALEHGVFLSEVIGHGENGRILQSDIDRYLEQKMFFEKKQARRKLEEEKEEASLSSLFVQSEIQAEMDEEQEVVSEEESEIADKKDDSVIEETEVSDFKTISEQTKEVEKEIIIDEEPIVSEALEENTEFSTEGDVPEKEDVQVDESEMEIEISETEVSDEVLEKEEEEIPTLKYDMIVVGCGVSGYSMALQAVGAGLKTAVIEKDLIGGKTLKDGAFPIVYLKKNAEFISKCRKAVRCGMQIKGFGLSLQQMMNDKAHKIDHYRHYMETHLAESGVDVFYGVAEVGIEGRVSILLSDERTMILEGDAIVLATGTTSRIPRQYENIPYRFTDGQAHDLERIPDEMMIIGSGAAACEYASIYSVLGTKITIITKYDWVLPDFDTEVRNIAERCLAAEHVIIKRNAVVNEVYRDSLGDLHLEISKGNHREGLICTDICVIQERLPNLSCMKQFGLEHFEKGIATDAMGRTAYEGIYAVGSVTGDSSVSPANVIETVMGRSEKVSKSYPVKRVNMLPEIAVVGLSETEAVNAGFDVVTRKLPLKANMQFFMEDSEKGFSKLIVEKNSEKILGAEFCCEHAGDLATVVQMILGYEGTVDDFKKILFYRPAVTAILGDLVE